MAVLKYWDETLSQWLPVAPGPKGDKGDKGDTGDLANLDIGTVTTGSPAAAHIDGNPEDGYELDLTLPSVGAGSIHDADVNAAADIDRTKIAGTALTAASMGVFNVLDYGAVGDGETDDIEALQDAFDAAGACTVLFPAGYTFAVSEAIIPTAGVTAIGHGATLLNTTKHLPVFDIVMTDDVTILGLSFLTEESRTYEGGASVRDNDVYAMWAGVLASGARLTVRDCTFTGFTCGISLHTWNGATRGGSCTGPTVIDCAFYGNDFGILVETASDVTLRGIRGTYSKQTGVGNPPHLIYLSHSHLQPGNTNVTIGDVHGWDSTEGHCVQVKDTVGAQVSGIFADNCAGILSIAATSQAHISGLTATNDDTPTFGSLYMQSGCEDIVVDRVLIATAWPTTTGARAGRIAGDRLVATNLTSLCDWSEQTDVAEWLVDGNGIDVRGVSSFNQSAYGATVVLVTSESTGVTVTDVRAANCRSGVKFNAPATGAVDVCGDFIVCGASIDSPFKVLAPSGVKFLAATGAAGGLL